MKQAEVKALLAIKGYTLEVHRTIFRISNKNGWMLRNHYECLVHDKDGNVEFITKYYLQRKSAINAVVRELLK